MFFGLHFQNKGFTVARRSVAIIKDWKLVTDVMVKLGFIREDMSKWMQMDEYRKAAQELFLLNILTYFAFVVSQL